MLIKTERLILREFNEKDYDFFYDCKTNKYIQEFETDINPTKEEVDKKFKEIIEKKSKKPRTSYDLLVEKKEDNITIGRVFIWEIDEKIKEWEIGWETHPNYAKNGYATEAAKAMIDLAFKKIKIHRLQAICNSRNISSEKVMIKINMIKEGTQRAVKYLNNRWDDIHIYSMLETDYLEKNN